MNKQRREEVQKAIALIEQTKMLIEEVANEEQDAFDNLPEGLQSSERGERMQDISACLTEQADSLDQIISYLEETAE